MTNELKERVAEYLSSHEVNNLAENTQGNYKNALDHLLNFAEHNKISTLNGAAIEIYKFAHNYMKHQALSGRTIQQYLNRVKIFMKWAGYTIEFTYRVSNFETKEQKKKQLQRWFNENDIAKCKSYQFLGYTYESALKYRIVIRLLSETGVRVRELAHVEAKDIDVENYTLWILDSKTEPRPTFFSPETRDLIVELKNSKIIWEGVLFPSWKRIQQIVQEMLDDLKINRLGRGPHTFRHFVATKLFYDGGMRIEDVATLMGTTGDNITKNYLHPTPLMLKSKVFAAMKWEEII